MKSNKKKNGLLPKGESPLKWIGGVYLLCWLARGVEYFILRTDQSLLGEAVVHKLLGIGLLALALSHLGLKWQQIGLSPRGAGKKLLWGLSLGLLCFALAYGVEFALLTAQGQGPKLAVYVASYGVTGNLGNQTAPLFFAICILGNIINVLMEEGVFRGLFLQLGLKKWGFWASAAFSSALFGLWHVVGPLRSYVDGQISPLGAAMAALTLVLTSAIAGLKFSMLTRISGSLWVPMADHFVNNAISNLLHMVAITGADGLQSLRITLAQSLSFVVVWLVYYKTKAGQKPAFRP